MHTLPIFGGLICVSSRCNGLGCILTFVAIILNLYLLLLLWETLHTLFCLFPISLFA
ncbi:hypothetical protein AMTRI_Chr04g180960 [Amborella trichopoda]